MERNWTVAAWPDWAINKSWWQPIFLQKYPKCLATCWAILKSIIFLSKTDAVTLGQLMELIGLLLFQHLVTLNERKVYGRMLSLAARNFDLKTKTFRVWSFLKKKHFHRLHATRMARPSGQVFALSTSRSSVRGPFFERVIRRSFIHFLKASILSQSLWTFLNFSSHFTE